MEVAIRQDVERAAEPVYVLQDEDGFEYLVATDEEVVALARALGWTLSRSDEGYDVAEVAHFHVEESVVGPRGREEGIALELDPISDDWARLFLLVRREA